MSTEEGKSGLFLYSLGIVVETKEFSVDEIYVTPIEHLNFENNRLVKDNKFEFKNDLPDKSGKVNSTVAKATTTLLAKWIPFGHSNRTTAPDVVKNETVILFKYSDIDEYFWTTIFREPELRRLERVLYSYSNLPTGIKEYKKDTSYWALVSTKDKMVQLHTSMNDGEHCTYDTTYDTKQGIFKTIDSKNNFIEFNSRDNDLNIEFRRDINRQADRDITAHADRDILHDADRDIKDTALRNIHHTASENIFRKAGLVIDDKAGVSITLSAPKITLNASILTLNAPTIILNGDVVITGSLTVHKISNLLGGVNAPPFVRTGNLIAAEATINGVKQKAD